MKIFFVSFFSQEQIYSFVLGDFISPQNFFTMFQVVKANYMKVHFFQVPFIADPPVITVSFLLEWF